MRIATPREVHAGETRVALVPESVRKLKAAGIEVAVETGAGALAGIADEEYRAAGADLVERAQALNADVVVVVHPPPEADIDRLREGGVLVGSLRPGGGPHLERLARRRISAYAFEALPRVTRAQPMDVLSSMATVAGYKAALIAADRCPRFFPMLMTAAGTITPATVLVIGAGVAGLQAIATCHRLGALVTGYDLRPAVKEQVESLGARFLELKDDAALGGEGKGGYAAAQTAEQQARQRQLLADAVAAADVVITTAQVPGRPAPRIIDAATVARMRPGSVVVDLAAESGGNCELTRAGEEVRTAKGALVLGPPNLPATMPHPASHMYSRNVLSLLAVLAPKGQLAVLKDDDVLGPALIVHDGQVRHGAAGAAAAGS